MQKQRNWFDQWIAHCRAKQIEYAQESPEYRPLFQLAEDLQKIAELLNGF